MATPSPLNPPYPSDDEQDESKNGVRAVRHRVHGRDASDFQVLQQEKGLLKSPQSAPPASGIELDPPGRAPSHTAVGSEYDDVSTGANNNDRPPDLTASTPWPGPNFQLKKVLPGSVYLWACGERGDRDGTSPVSRPESWAAWVVLITQFLCYVELWVVSKDHSFPDGPLSPDGEATTASSSSYIARDYSIVAIAVAMYLLLSIAAADLWGGLALLLEGHGGSSSSESFAWLTPRRVYGACLLSTFAALVGASTRVLFYSSFENVDWVLGAAAVLFIADVDEKAMGVLKNVGGSWRLFWVLQVIGSSFGLAVLVVRLTGSGDTVSGGERCESVWSTNGCSIYSWGFILNGYPLTITLFSLLVTRAVSPGRRPEFPVEPAAGGIGAPTRSGRNRVCFSLALACWALCRLASFLFVPPQDYSAVSTAVGVTTLFAGGAALSCGCGYYCRRLKTAYARGPQRLRPIDRRRRRLLFWSGFLLVVARAVFDGVYVADIASVPQHEYYRSVLQPARNVLGACDAIFDSVVDAWLVCGMGLTEINSPNFPLGVDPGRPLSSLLWPMLVGWCLFEAYLALHHWVAFGALDFGGQGWYWRVFPAFNFAGDVVRLVWRLVVGTLLWGWAREVRAVAYWLAANRLMGSFLWCLLTVITAATDEVVT